MHTCGFVLTWNGIRTRAQYVMHATRNEVVKSKPLFNTNCNLQTLEIDKLTPIGAGLNNMGYHVVSQNGITVLSQGIRGEGVRVF